MIDKGDMVKTIVDIRFGDDTIPSGTVFEVLNYEVGALYEIEVEYNGDELLLMEIEVEKVS